MDISALWSILQSATMAQLFGMLDTAILVLGIHGIDFLDRKHWPMNLAICLLGGAVYNLFVYALPKGGIVSNLLLLGVVCLIGLFFYLYRHDKA